MEKTRWLQERPTEFRAAFEVGGLVERLQRLLDLELYADEARDIIAIIRHHLATLNIPCSMNSLECLLVGKTSLGEIPHGERETFSRLLKDLKWLVSPL